MGQPLNLCPKCKLAYMNLTSEGKWVCWNCDVDDGPTLFFEYFEAPVMPSPQSRTFRRFLEQIRERNAALAHEYKDHQGDDHRHHQDDGRGQ